jgi:RNA polymerase sigma-70 factor (ECF subfamily)
MKALKRVDDAVDFDPESAADTINPDPESAMQQVERTALLDRALAALSVDHRAVIQLTYYEGRSCKEVAAIMDCPVDTVKTRMFHARRRLRMLIVNQGEGEL